MVACKGGGQPGFPLQISGKYQSLKIRKPLQILIQEIEIGLKWPTLKLSDPHRPPVLERICGTPMFVCSYFNFILIQINGKRVFRTPLRLECCITIEGPDLLDLPMSPVSQNSL